MSEDPGGHGKESSPYLRLPLPNVAGGLLAFVVLVLAVGLFANRNLRPQPGLVATPVVAVAVATQSATVAAAQPTPATATPIVLPTATAVVVPVVVAIATAPPSPTPGPTVSPELATEVAADAYTIRLGITFGAQYRFSVNGVSGSGWESLHDRDLAWTASHRVQEAQAVLTRP